MNTIKHRVWSLKYKTWMNHCAVLDCQGKLGSHFFELDDSGGLAREHLIGLATSDYIIQRYIGLTDINGREIYEGDILYGELDLRSEMSGDLMIFRGEVIYTPPMFTVKNADFLLNDYTTLEVLGNVCEHPDLLAAS